MSKRIINILCEGQSEQEFALKVLKLYLLPYDIIVRANLLITNRKLHAQGGIIDYQQVKRDLHNMIRSAKDTKYEMNFFTTMFDLYALPTDFPGYVDSTVEPYKRVATIEQAFGNDADCYRFIPYIELHEFETLVLCNLPKVSQAYPNAQKQLRELDVNWRKETGENVELVNSSRATAPSKRLMKAVEHYYNYDKKLMAVVATKDMGIDALRAQCVHFNQWIEKLLNI